MNNLLPDDARKRIAEDSFSSGFFGTSSNDGGDGSVVELTADPGGLASAVLRATAFILQQDEFRACGHYLFEACRKQLNAESGYLLLWDNHPDNERFVIIDSCFRESADWDGIPREIVDLQSKVSDTGRPVIENEAGGLHAGCRNFMMVPVFYAENISGFLAFGNKKGEFSGEDIVVAESFAGLITMAIDHTQKIKELKQARQRAEESDRLKSAFISNMSHEIRTPLNSILGFSDLLSEPDLEPADRRNYIRIINQNGDQLMSIINNVLDISLIESGQIRLYRELIDPAEVIREVFELFQAPGLKKKNVNFAIDCSCLATTRLMTDRARLRQILVNLMGNAIKFTLEGHVIIGCRERMAPEGREVVLSVEDTGTGIPADKLLTIFDRFRQADLSTTRRFGGFGLGLAISRGLTELLGGRIEVESEIGVGSTFRVFFPCPESAVTP